MQALVFTLMLNSVDSSFNESLPQLNSVIIKYMELKSEPNWASYKLPSIYICSFELLYTNLTALESL